VAVLRIAEVREALAAFNVGLWNCVALKGFKLLWNCEYSFEYKGNEFLLCVEWRTVVAKQVDSDLVPGRNVRHNFLMTRILRMSGQTTCVDSKWHFVEIPR
jgi:hypothetical protein